MLSWGGEGGAVDFCSTIRRGISNPTGGRGGHYVRLQKRLLLCRLLLLSVSLPPSALGAFIDYSYKR